MKRRNAILIIAVGVVMLVRRQRRLAKERRIAKLLADADECLRAASLRTPRPRRAGPVLSATNTCRMIGHDWPYSEDLLYARHPEAIPPGTYHCSRCGTTLTIGRGGSRTYTYPPSEIIREL